MILYERGGTIRQIDEWFRRRASPRVAMELGNAEAIKKLVARASGSRSPPPWPSPPR